MAGKKTWRWFTTGIQAEIQPGGKVERLKG
jgi:hypothetical protein